MGNLLRLMLLLLTLAAVVVAGIVHYRGDLVDGADRRFQRWFVQSFKDELQAVEAMEMPGGRDEAIGRLQQALGDLESTRLGDNRFPIWRQMTELLGSHFAESGKDEDAIRLFLGALELDPNNMEFRASLIRALIRLGSTESLESAEHHLAFIEERFPEWSLCKELAMTSAIGTRNGTEIAMALEVYQAHQLAEMLDNWQVFLFPHGGKLIATDLVRAVKDPDGPHFRLKFEAAVPEGGLAKFRLDPPSSQFGLVQDWGLAVKSPDGSEMLKGPFTWSAVKGAEVLENGSIRLVGKKDPQFVLSFKEPKHVSSVVEVEFWFRPGHEVPDEIRTLLEDDSIRLDFEAYFASRSGGKL